MSPHNVNNFVGDLLQMAKAMEELPQVQAQLTEANRVISGFEVTIELRQADLDQSRAYAASLEQKVRDLEVARDDAELAFLEADDRTSRAVDFIKATFANAGALLQALEPPKAAPQADSIPLSGSGKPMEGFPGNPIPGTFPEGERGSDPIVHDTTQTIQPASAPTMEATASSQVDVLPQGQREPDPTVSLTESQSTSAPSIVENTTNVASVDTALGRGAEPVALPYLGKNYYDVPNTIPYDIWIAGGGTDHDYFNRRTA